MHCHVATVLSTFLERRHMACGPGSLVYRLTVALWLQVMPIIAVMGVGGAWLTFVTSRYLFMSPDTQWSRSDRGNMWRSNFTEGSKWASHRSALAAKDVANTSVVGMTAINNFMGGTVKEE